MDFTYLLAGKNPDGKNMTIYECSKRSGIPYSTLSDLLHGKTPAERATFRTAYYLAATLGITMEELYEQMHVPERISFELFKSSICHKVKEKGDESFIVEALSNNEIRKYYHLKWYKESFYLLAMLDYLSRENNIPICSDYDDLRKLKLSAPVYPSSVLAICEAMGSDEAKKEALRAAIPEFIRHNIVESEVRNVI